jgi:hypothetical protein
VPVHDGTWTRAQARCIAILQAACRARPERFHGRCPAPKTLPAKVWDQPAACDPRNRPVTTTTQAA